MKTLHIKVIKAIFLLAFFMQNLYGQQQLGQGSGGISIASPSMAAMSLYADTPVNLSTGVPDITLPIVDIPITDQNVKNVFTLNYNPAFVNADPLIPASDVGAGWSLFGGSVIYKKIIDILDETYDNASVAGYKKNTFDDFYYYSLPGLSGRFQIKQDTVNNTFSLINLTPNNIKFEYERENNTATLKIKNFTVTDGKGYKFYFNDFDYETIPSGDLSDGTGYISSYFLSKITSPTGKILALYSYDKKSKTTTYNNKLLYQYCKLTTIETDMGKVVFDYNYDESLADTPNDLYSLQKITLKNKADQQISNYTFNYIKSSVPNVVKKQKRLLASISKNDKNNVKLEQTSFIYNQSINSPEPSPGICNWGGSTPDSYYDNFQFTNLLEKIITPTGGVTQYEFAFNEVFLNYDQAYLDSIMKGYVDSRVQYTEEQPVVNFDTNQSSVYTFTIAGDPSKKVGFNIIFNPEGYHDNKGPFKAEYKVKSSTGEYLNKNGCVTGAALFENTYYGYAGTYTLEISGTGHPYGYYLVREVKLHPGPYKNSKKNANDVTPHQKHKVLQGN